MRIPLGHRYVAPALWFAAALPLLADRAFAQQDDPVPLFASNEVVELTLAAPIRTLVNRRGRRPEVDGTVSYTDPNGATTALAVEVTTRGHNRLEVCSFPPLRLDFRRREVAGTLFSNQNRLKLVTVCRGYDDYLEYLELEYLAYRIFGLVTDLSFNVRPLRIRYVDTDRKDRETVAPGFLIEDIDGVAARVGLEAVDMPRIGVDELHREQIAAFAIFQYLIGNTDWSALRPADGEECCHNGAVLANAGGSPPYRIVPYDFDHAGLVDTSYALPSEKLDIRRVTDRLYRGFCISNDFIDDTIAEFRAARPAIETLIANAELTDETREKALGFLAEGYRVLNDPVERQSKIVDQCRG